MATYTQANRSLALTTPLGQDALLLERFQGTEAISTPFSFQLDLLAEQPVPFDKVLGQKASVTVRFRDRPQRYVTGIISRLTQDGRVRARDGKTVFLRYHAELVPRLWLLSRRVQSRIFQHLTVPEILHKLLRREWGLDVQFQVRGTYPPLDYCVQYRESDLALVSRLMEDEGIFYYFLHTADRETLVVSDATTIHPELPGRSTIAYDEVVGGTRPEGRVTGWRKTQEVRAAKLNLWDYCFELPTSHLEAQRTLPASVPVDQQAHRLDLQTRVNNVEMLQVFDHPGGYAKRFDGVNAHGAEQRDHLQRVFQDNQRTVKVRSEEEAVAALTVEGTSDCAHFLPGHRFTLEKHFLANGPYLLTRVDHEASLVGEYLPDPTDEGPLYQNRFQGIPLALPYRPRRVTPKPTILGTQTAVVVGPLGSEIFVDKYGRVKVQFHWDREGKHDADSSCWVRVAQLWAGKGWGAFFWPRVGHEVVVAFEEGDPDQPIVVGSVYNAQNMPPLDLPADSMLGGIKSCIFTGNPGAHFNAVIFHDKPGHEYVQVHSEKHEMCNSETNRFHYVHRAQFNFHGTF
jgi:type VI secretion system secreted protein VgrG